MIVVAKSLIPGDCFIQSCGLVWLLIVDGAGAKMIAGAGGDDFAINDVDIPAKLVVRSIVASVAQGDTKIKRICFVVNLQVLFSGWLTAV